MMSSILHDIAKLVRSRERSLPQGFDRGEEIGRGADGSPTCAIDKVAEDVILDYVESNDLPYNVLSEEAGWVDRGKDRTLVVDPIDGTYNAIMGIPFYSVSLAIGNRSLLGVEEGLVQNLVTGDIYYAKKGRGATFNGEPIHTRKFDSRRSVFLVYLGKYSSASNFNFAKRGMRARAMGCASLEMCILAQGRADAFFMDCEVYERSIRVVDIAASALILREAGGEILDMNDRPLDMEFDLKARSNFIAYGDEELRRWVM
ncbi:MAG: inositol monophosphatase family protein [Methanomassiliicoccales archaeon]